MSRNPLRCVVPAVSIAVRPDEEHEQTDVRRVCALDVRSETLHEALSHVAVRNGWDLVRHQGPGIVPIRDRVVALEGEQSSRRSVLVVDPTPLQCQRALRAFGAGTVAAVISSDRPSALAHALLSVSDGWGAVPVAVLEVAATMPELSERQEGILGAVMAGQSSAEIARGLYLSEASVKRELAGLFRSFGARNRLELAMLAGDLGITPVRMLP